MKANFEYFFPCGLGSSAFKNDCVKKAQHVFASKCPRTQVLH